MRLGEQERDGRGRYPDFIGIGAQKSGTTWLYQQLRQHPELFLPEPKELNFFYQERSLDWYLNKFALVGPTQVCGEISPNYFAQPHVAERIHERLPDARLFCILRDPAQRAYSQWKMARKLGNIKPTTPFIEAFRSNERLIADQGDYSMLLQRFLPYYRLGESLQVYWYDDLCRAPGELLDSVCGFLGVSEGLRPSDMGARVWQAEDRDCLGGSELGEVKAYYEASIQKLEALLGVGLDHWR